MQHTNNADFAYRHNDINHSPKCYKMELCSINREKVICYQLDKRPNISLSEKWSLILLYNSHRHICGRGRENLSLASAALTGHIWCMVKLHIHSSLYALQFFRLLPSVHNQISCSDTSHKVPLPHMQSLATAG